MTVIPPPVTFWGIVNFWYGFVFLNVVNAHHQIPLTSKWNTSDFNWEAFGFENDVTVSVSIWIKATTTSELLLLFSNVTEGFMNVLIYMSGEHRMA